MTGAECVVEAARTQRVSSSNPVIAIHHRKGSYSDYWISWCEANGVDFRIVDAYSTGVVREVRAYDGFMWHWHQDHKADPLFARQLILSLDSMGMPVFPNPRTCWHFDDKLGQKYLLEALDLPLVPSFAFYTAEAALEWVATASLPLVFKLRGGAGSMNVKLVTTLEHAQKLIRKAFDFGFSSRDQLAAGRQARWLYKRDGGVERLLRAQYRTVRGAISMLTPASILSPRETGYVYFQKFIPGCAFDHRMIVIGDRCFCIQRAVRTGDFRASGSGLLSYSPELFPRRTVKMAFDAAKRLGTQSLALDVLYDSDGNHYIGEVSYGFPRGRFAENCPGFFDSKLNWHEGQQIPPNLMIDDFVRSIVDGQ